MPASFLLKIRSHLIVFPWDKNVSFKFIYVGTGNKSKIFFLSSKWEVANFLARKQV